MHGSVKLCCSIT